ncbi:hypothetical protein CKAN_02016300 [Cinnamomum micranthum f. kanehirae]|uniref:Transmembrane protein n=1 Tax=Cinnamomum micranthum f. kanehirae TaxID=337451 RepID=A0A3S3QV49_9MAGN|nr:hypothetical protein CKAN_02016300 [Cinnamomum micranthum f. kanehirae]
MSDPAIDFFGVLSESRRILTAHSRHFLALSVLFLLPLSFFLIAAPTFVASIRSDTNHAETLLRYAPPSKTPTLSKTLSLSLAYAAATLFLSLSAIASVTSSVRHGFFGRPVKLFSALRSLSSSLWRLLLTSTAALASISLLSAIVVFIAVRSLSVLDLCSAYAIALVLIGFGAISLQANWALAPVVVVVELSWGVEPLRRSAFLIKGFRRVAVALGLFFSLGVALMLRLSFFGREGPGLGWRRELPIAQTALASAVMMLLLLYGLAANAVLYMYCKAVKGELAGMFRTNAKGDNFMVISLNITLLEAQRT